MLILIIPFILYSCAVLNLVAFILFGIDKFRAIQDQWRIPETLLLGIAALGGALGAIIGMYFFHHKTLHKRFVFGLPLLLILQILFFFHSLLHLF